MVSIVIESTDNGACPDHSASTRVPIAMDRARFLISLSAASITVREISILIITGELMIIFIFLNIAEQGKKVNKQTDYLELNLSGLSGSQ